MNNKTFVSRAGQKLQFALESFNIDVKDKQCLDLGCSTGGFTDCLLQNGASEVVAVDTAYGELDWKLRNDPRVKVFERTNALFFDPKQNFDLITIDVGWTKQVKILPMANNYLNIDGSIISLLKPHYEIGIKNLKNGKVPDELADKYLHNIFLDLGEVLLKYNLELKKYVRSPLVGDKAGNTEYILWIAKQ